MNGFRFFLLCAALLVATAMTTTMAERNTTDTTYQMQFMMMPALNTTAAPKIQTRAHTSDVCYSAPNMDMNDAEYRLRNVKAPSSSCCGICKNDDNCRAFTWTNYEGGTCYLKYFPSPVTFKNGATSTIVVLQSYSQQIYYTLANCDMPGNDIGSTTAKSQSECAPKCVAFSRCRAYTWTNYNGGTCWFKNDTRVCAYAAGVTTGIVFK